MLGRLRLLIREWLTPNQNKAWIMPIQKSFWCRIFVPFCNINPRKRLIIMINGLIASWRVKKFIISCTSFSALRFFLVCATHKSSTSRRFGFYFDSACRFARCKKLWNGEKTRLSVLVRRFEPRIQKGPHDFFFKFAILNHISCGALGSIHKWRQWILESLHVITFACLFGFSVLLAWSSRSLPPASDVVYLTRLLLGS